MALSLLHRAWRGLPPDLRRRAFVAASAAIAPRPDRAAPRPDPAAPVAVGGEIGRASGLGEGARLMLAALRQAGVPAEGFACGPLEAGTPPGPGPLVLHVNAPLLPAALLRMGRDALRGRRVAGYWAWELPTVPPAWRAGARFVHEVWAPSQFTAAALEAVAPGRVRVVPHPVGAVPPVPAALGRADFSLPEDAFIVLVSFSLASSRVRKNPEAAIDAFRAAFGADSGAHLVLKISHAEDYPEELATLRARADAANIRIETRLLPAADSHALTRCADAVLSLHRSEGFGLVPAEAMALGRPVVATNWSGVTDFLDAATGFPVGYTLVPAQDPRGVFEAPGAVWAEADIGEAAACLRAIRADPARAAALGAAARAAIRLRLSDAPLLAAVAALRA